MLIIIYRFIPFITSVNAIMSSSDTFVIITVLSFSLSSISPRTIMQLSGSMLSHSSWDAVRDGWEQRYPSD